MKKRLLIFLSALTPYRIDFFNVLATYFDCTVIFVSRNNKNQPFCQKELFEKCHFKRRYMDIRIVLPQNRVLNIGYLYYILKYKPDIVIGAEYGLPTILPYLYKKLFLRKYTVYTICDDSIDIAENGGSLARKKLRNYFVKRLDGLILVSQDVARWYSSHFPLKQPPIVFPIVYNEDLYQRMLGQIMPISKVHQEHFGLKNKKIILFVGRLTEVKNIPLLIKAFYKLSDADDVRLVLVGDGDKKDELKTLVQNLHLEDKVIFAGRFEGDKLYAWYNIANLFVLPSIYEPFGAVTAEALEAGCQVLCSDRAGSSGLINETNGKTFDPTNGNYLADLLAQSISTMTYIDIDDRKPRPSLLPYSFDNYVKNMIDLLH